MRCAVGMTDWFKVEMRLHQGSTLNPFLLVMVMFTLRDKIRHESPWAMMFTDDMVICSESREQVKANLERWRNAQRKRTKVSSSKVGYM